MLNFLWCGNWYQHPFERLYVRRSIHHRREKFIR